MKSTSTDPNTVLLDALGVPWKDVTACDISLRPNRFPLVTLERILLPPISEELQTLTQRLHLVPLDPPAPAPEPPPLDIEALCEAARKRLREGIDQAARVAIDEMETHAALYELAELLRTQRWHRGVSSMGAEYVLGGLAGPGCWPAFIDRSPVALSLKGLP